MMKLNVGLNRKCGEANYGSRGGSVNLEVELDNSLASDPDRLRETVSRLFGLVRKSLEDELAGTVSTPAVAVEHKPIGQALQGLASGRQLKFCEGLAYQQRRDLRQICQDRFGKNPGAISSKEASELIKEWSAPMPARTGS